MTKRGTVYITHCVDTEGPLHETLEATFQRFHERFGIKMEPSQKLLQKIQKKEIDLGGLEEKAADFVAPKRLAYLSRWDDVEEMIRAVTCIDYRQKYADPKGNPYTFTWFIVDVVGYRDNPRDKAQGFHAVWDKYMRFLDKNLYNDAMGWHFHTVPVGNHALHYNTCWTNNDYHEQVLARRIIERSWFPSAFRAGGHIERNDLSFWLEQFIPFDYSCHSLEKNIYEPGSQQDWRFSPVTWGAYHPDFYDYRKPGRMKRRIFRCLDFDSNNIMLDRSEVEKAFQSAQEGNKVILAYSSHDRRDMRPKIEKAASLIKDVARCYADVDWEYANALDAARKACALEERPAPLFSIEREKGTFLITSDQPLFGPIPFLAVEEENGIFYRDNPTQESETRWAYTCIRPEKTLRIGVGASNASGNTGTKTILL
ncbi:MAG: hypothetical protein JW928_05005 [Candidatus Aureabacteria bacterium]|nr:hypothetical protein [Candidatus Auribacterota bacterium]